MNRDCSIGIDQGSSSTKAVIVTAGGAVLPCASRALSLPKRTDARVEQDPREIVRSVEQAMQEAVHAARRAGYVPRCVGLSCQRSSCLVWRERTAEPLSPVLSWRDRREAAFVESLSPHQDRILRLTGLPLTPYYAASKFRWLRQNKEAELPADAVFGTLSSFLTQALAKGDRALIDHTNAGRTQLMNINTLAWDPELLDLFGLGGISLPAIVPTAQGFGIMDTEAGALPLFAVIGDQQAAMVGLGVARAGEGGINYGTGGFLMANTGDRLLPVPGLMASVHYSLAGTVRYLVEGSVNAAGDGLAWLRDRFGFFRRDDEVEALCRSAAGDAVVFLGLNGTGAPHWEKSISTAVHGLTGNSSPGEIVRGVVEGIAFFLTDIAQAMRTAGIDPEIFSVSGGLASLRYLLEAQASLLERPLVRSAEAETSALGAALLAGIPLGLWPLDGLPHSRAGERIEPAPDPGLIRRYERWRELHRHTAELDRA